MKIVLKESDDYEKIIYAKDLKIFWFNRNFFIYLLFLSKMLFDLMLFKDFIKIEFSYVLFFINTMFSLLLSMHPRGKFYYLTQSFIEISKNIITTWRYSCLLASGVVIGELHALIFDLIIFLGIYYYQKMVTDLSKAINITRNNEVDDKHLQQLSFNRTHFQRADFNVERFVNLARKRATLEQLHSDLRTYLRHLQNCMISEY